MFDEHSVAGVYYINLDHRSDRNEHMQRLLKYCPWPYSRVPAVRLRVEPGAAGYRLAERHREQPHVASIFLSHQRSLLTALSADNDGLSIVMEDDLQIDPALFRLSSTDLSPLPSDWDVVLVSVRYRERPREPGQPVTWLQHPYGPGLVSARRVTPDIIVTGAHFCIFQNRAAIARILTKMGKVTEIEDLDIWYIKNTNCFYLHSDLVGTKPSLGSNHHDKLESTPL